MNATLTISEAPMMTLQDVAKHLRYTTRHVINLVDSGRIPAPIRIGKHPRWPRHQIIAWIEAGCPAAESDDQTNRKNA